jgi:hypothetical protein
MSIEKNTQILAKYLPEVAAPLIAKWIDYFQCEFKISRKRSTKLGDYRHPYRDSGHRISVNHDLNPFAFLVTTVHEFAHLLTWNEFKHSVKPHGIEWKNNFQKLMQPFFDQQVFPEDIYLAIRAYMDNPAASSCTDLHLARTLKSYNEIKAHHCSLEMLAPLTIFTLPDGRRFEKGEQLRKRFKCRCLDNGRYYLVNPLAEVNIC